MGINFNSSGLQALYDGRLNAPRYIEILENALIPIRDLNFGIKDILVSSMNFEEESEFYLIFDLTLTII